MAGDIKSLLLFPLAFTMLVLSKIYLVTKGALVPVLASRDPSIRTIADAVRAVPVPPARYPPTKVRRMASRRQAAGDGIAGGQATAGGQGSGGATGTRRARGALGAECQARPSRLARRVRGG